MNVLVVSNCATSAYTNGLRVLFPDWDIRGVISDLAQQWATADPPKVEFIKFLRNCDIYVGNPSAGICGKLLPEKNRRVPIPHFWFRGMQPDCVHLRGFDSVLGTGGNLYSRIVLASFQAGLTLATTRKLFNSKTYEVFGFLTCYDEEKQGLIDRFARHNIDLSGSVGRWLASGNFLYSYNHPRIDVLMEILSRALVAANLLPISKLVQDDNMGVPDDLSESFIWPVYPEIARLHGLEGSLIWRKGRMKNYQTLDLDQFIEASFDALAAKELPKMPELPTWEEWVKSLAAGLP